MKDGGAVRPLALQLRRFRCVLSRAARVNSLGDLIAGVYERRGELFARSFCLWRAFCSAAASKTPFTRWA